MKRWSLLVEQITWSGNSSPVQVFENQVTIFQLDPTLRTIGGAPLQSKAVMVTSDADITVHGLNSVLFSSDGFLAVPVTEGSMEFYIPSYQPLG